MNRTETDSHTPDIGDAGLVLVELHPRLRRRFAEAPAGFVPTSDGIVAAAGRECGCERLLGLYPVSRQWFRVLAERLDSVALLYRVAAMIAELRSAAAILVSHPCQTQLRSWVRRSHSRWVGARSMCSISSPACRADGGRQQASFQSRLAFIA